MKVADIEFIDAVTGKVKKVGDLFDEIKELKRELEDAKDKLKDVKDYVYSHVNFNEDDGIHSKTAGYDILDIIGKI